MTCCTGITTTRISGPHLGEYCANCDKWIKWISQEKKWESFIMPIGKHKGKTLFEIAENDGEYILWGAKNLAGNLQRKFKQAIEETKKQVKEQ